MRSCVVAATFGLAVFATELVAHARPDETPVSVYEREAREKSRAAFRAGVAQLQSKDWKAARASFESAWALYPHPSILLNLGIARLRTDDPVLAEQDFVRFLSEDFGATAEELAGAREALAEARTKIGTIKVVVSPSTARIVVDGRPIAERVASSDEVLAEVRAKPGRHSVQVDADGHAPQQRTLDLAARAEVEVKIALVPAAAMAKTPIPSRTEETTTSGRKILGYGLAGLAAVALATTAVCGVRAIGLAADYGDRSKAEFQDPAVKSEGETFRTVADVALGVGIVSGVGAIVLLFTDIGALKTTASKRAPLVLRW
jgi:hypothetical protein